jgi:hypothetical protein
LTISDTVALSTIIEAAVHGSKVRWLNPAGDVMEGVARSIGDEKGNFAGPKDDIRDCFLRISAMFEYFLPVSDLIPMVQAGTFVVGD